MDLKLDSIFGLEIFLAIALIVPETKAEVRSTSACFGTNSDCSYYSLQCDKGHVIRPTVLNYGVKNYKCTNGRRRCLDANRDGCCAYNADDCFEKFTANHAYIVYRQCSGQQSCKSLQATRNILSSCEGNISTYIYIEYECVKAEDIKQFCETTDVFITTAPTIHIQFNPEAHSSTSTNHCSCQITSQSNQLHVEYVDVRMFRKFTDGGKSVCSSAALESIPNDDVTSECSTSVTDDENFVYDEQTVLEKSSIYRYRLSDIYKNGKSDRPVKVWLQLKDESGGNVNAVCFQEQDATPTYFPTTPDPDNPYNTSVLPDTGDDDGNTAAIVAGILVPILVIVAVGTIIGIVCWRKKNRKRPGSFRGTARRNTYVEEIYDEIADVPEPVSASVQNHTYNSKNAVYDPVYEPGNRIYDPVYEPSNSHNRNSSESEHKAKKNTKLMQPVKVLRDQTDKIISFFRKPESKSNDNSENITRNRENSDAYDHLKGAKNIKVEVIPPDHEPNHEYSHSKDFQKVSQRSSVASEDEEPNVLHVGENYLEFKFGELEDADQYNLVTMRQVDPNYKPKPPSRPSPQPSPKLGDALRPNSAKTASPSGNNLSPTGFTYDYADNSRKNSNASDISEHSYKVLEKLEQVSNELPLYDYADLSDREIEKEIIDVDGVRVSVYEDVDNNGNGNQEGKGDDDMYDSHGYLAPVTTRRNSPVPSEDGPKLQTASFPDLNQLSKEIAAKKLKPVQQKNKQTDSDRTNPDLSPRKDANANNNVIKSDNTKIKQYDKSSPQKAKKATGADKTREASNTGDDQMGKDVLKMAKMFENKQNQPQGDTRRGSSDA